MKRILVPAAVVLIIAGTVLAFLQLPVPAAFALTSAPILLFYTHFEGSGPKARDIVIPAVLVGLAVAGRAVFFMLPNIKPLMAIVILSGVYLGAKSGFLVGSLSILLSNMFFSQGVWTPFQMLGAGFCGMIAGWLFYNRKSALWVIMLYAFASVILIYSLISDLSTLLFIYTPENPSSVWAVFAAGLPFSLTHAFATCMFIALLNHSLSFNLTRVKKKFGRLGT